MSPKIQDIGGEKMFWNLEGNVLKIYTFLFFYFSALLSFFKFKNIWIHEKVKRKEKKANVGIRQFDIFQLLFRM